MGNISFSFKSQIFLKTFFWGSIFKVWTNNHLLCPPPSKTIAYGRLKSKKKTFKNLPIPGLSVQDGYTSENLSSGYMEKLHPSLLQT